MKPLVYTLRQCVARYPLSSLLIVAIWVVCLIPIPEVPLQGVRFIDKWTHLAMYAALAIVVIAERWWRRAPLTWRRLLLFAFALPCVMGGAIEVVQAWLTGGRRSGEWLDAAADAVGAAMGFLVGTLAARCLSTRRKGAAR